jgi:hypothetical protein
VIIKEAVGFEGNIGSWNLVNRKTGEVLASGSGAGFNNFDPVTLRKISFEITGSSGTPAVAEFETHAVSSRKPPEPTPRPTPEPTPEPIQAIIKTASPVSKQIRYMVLHPLMVARPVVQAVTAHSKKW